MSRDQPLVGLGPSFHLSALASFVFYATYKFMRFVQHCHLTLYYPEVWTEINLYFIRHRHFVRATENGSRQLFLWDVLLRTTKQAISSPVEIHAEILYRGIPNINQACIWISKVHLKSEAFGSTEIFSPKLTLNLGICRLKISQVQGQSGQANWYHQSKQTVWSILPTPF